MFAARRTAAKKSAQPTAKPKAKKPAAKVRKRVKTAKKLPVAYRLHPELMRKDMMYKDEFRFSERPDRLGYEAHPSDEGKVVRLSMPEDLSHGITMVHRPAIGVVADGKVHVTHIYYPDFDYPWDHTPHGYYPVKKPFTVSPEETDIHGYAKVVNIRSGKSKGALPKAFKLHPELMRKGRLIDFYSMALGATRDLNYPARPKSAGKKNPVPSDEGRIVQLWTKHPLDVNKSRIANLDEKGILKPDRYGTRGSDRALGVVVNGKVHLTHLFYDDYGPGRGDPGSAFYPLLGAPHALSPGGIDEITSYAEVKAGVRASDKGGRKRQKG